MKKSILIALCIFFTFSNFSFSEDSATLGNFPSVTDENFETAQTEEEISFPTIVDKPFWIFNFCPTYSMVTRIIYQDDYSRSNFVWQNHLIGLSIEALSVNVKPADSILRIGLYYPIYYSFNGMEQAAKQTILYAFDLFWGPRFQTDMWDYVYINFAFGPHFLYQLSDEYHHIELGGAVLLGLEWPISKRWTVVSNGLFSVDYGNLGSNRDIQPYNLVYNYQIELGFRYSRKKPNKYPYTARYKAWKTKRAEAKALKNAENEATETSSADVTESESETNLPAGSAEPSDSAAIEESTAQNP